MKKLRKYRFTSIEEANQYINAISNENSAVLLNEVAQKRILGTNPNFNKELPISEENYPNIEADIDFSNQYLVDVIWNNEINSSWSEFEVFPTITLSPWKSRIFIELENSEKNSVMAEYSLYLNNKNLIAAGRNPLLENDFFILNNYVMAVHFNKNGNLLTGESVSLDAKSNAAIMIHTIHESVNLNYNFKLETDNTEDVLKVIILEKESDETPKEVLFETNTTEIKNGVISLKRGNVIAFEYIKKSYSESNKVTFTLGY